MLITKISGYVDTPIAKKCATCKYLVDGQFCRNSTVQKDPQVKTDAKTGRKIVSASDGCCNEWDPSPRKHWAESLIKGKP